MIFIAKLVTWFLSPAVLGIAGMVLAFLFLRRGKVRKAWFWFGGSLSWLWLWSSAFLYVRLGAWMEMPYPPQRAEDAPAADAIVLLGGGMEGPAGRAVYPELFAGADRVWHAARLYRAGKAPVVITSGLGENRASAVLLRDLGVPGDAVRVENDARNTAQNALFTRSLLGTNRNARILLVTSAYHMRRARLVFERSGLDVIPAAADHEALLTAATGTSRLLGILPNPDMLNRNSYLAKEWLGYWIYRLCWRPKPGA